MLEEQHQRIAYLDAHIGVLDRQLLEIASKTKHASDCWKYPVWGR
jgi:hypothetical protein